MFELFLLKLYMTLLELVFVRIRLLFILLFILFKFLFKLLCNLLILLFELLILLLFLLICVFDFNNKAFFSSSALSFGLFFISSLFDLIKLFISFCCLEISFDKNLSSSLILKLCKYNSSGLLLLIMYISLTVEYSTGIFLLFLCI